jgi:hypothetical protein
MNMDIFSFVFMDRRMLQWLNYYDLYFLYFDQLTNKPSINGESVHFMIKNTDFI